MKKMNKVAKVMVTLISVVAALTISSCEKDEIFENSSTITPTPTRTDVRWLFARDTMWAIFTNGDTLPTQQVTSSPKIRAERIYKEEGTNGIAPSTDLEAAFVSNNATSFPYNYGINNEVYVNQYVTLTVGGVTYENVPSAETLKVRGWHTVDNVASAPFHEQSHTTYTLLNGQGEVVIINGDSITCRQNFAVREVVPTVIHDTVWKERVIHDTLWRERIVHDTIHQIDTIWQERIVHDTVVDGRWVDSVVTRRHAVVSHHHIATTTTDTYTPSTATYTVRCTNRTDSAFTERLYLYYSDLSVDSSRVRNWTHSINWQKVWSRNVTLNGSNPGSGRVPISGGTANFGGGNSVVFSTATVTTNPAGYNPAATNCTDVLMYATSVSGGVNIRTVVNHGSTGDSTQGFIPWNGTTPPTPPTVVRIDTVWGNCTTANNGVYNPATERVSFVVHKQYRLDTVFSDNTHGYSSWLTANATYQYMVTRTGQPMLSMINSIPLTIGSDNTATFGGGAFTETLTPVGTQRFCPLTLTSAVLTSNGTVWTGSYGTSTPTVTVTETFVTPTPWEDVVYMVVTDGYEQQIFSAQSQRHQFLEIITYNSATGYKKFYKDVTNMPTVMPSRSSCDDSTSLTSAQYNFYVSSASNGFYATQVIPHNSLTILPDGVVKSEELTNWWQLTFRLDNNTQAYVMGGSSWTMAGDSGRNALRGQADLANHTITVDYGGGNTRTWYFN